MATLTASNLTLLDIAKQTDPDGGIADVVEVLAKQNPIVEDAIAMECNMGTKHRHTIRTGLPSVSWGALYQGIPQSKGLTQQVDDTTGFVEALSSVDKRLLDISKNPAKVRLNEASGFLEAMNQEVSTGFFYHDTATTPEKIKGLASRYNTLSNSQVVNASGSDSDLTSIWFVTWGENFTHMIYPEGVTAGLKREDKGEQRVLDGNNNPYFVKEELFTWHLGVAVRDWRYNARIANIDVSNARGGSVDLYTYMRNAYYKLQSRRVAGGKQVIYMNRDMLEVLDALATNKGSSDNFVRLERREVEGQEVMTYRGIPIRETDALLNTETAVA